MKYMLAICNTLCALLCSTALAAPVDQTMTDLGHSILKQLIEINTTAAHGSTPAAQAIYERLQNAGFSGDDLQLLAPASHPERANVVVRLRGKNLAKPVLYIGHLDVVEALRADWSMDPFTLNEQDGWLYGRGTIDMKGQDTALLTSLLTLKQQGFVPDRDIIVAFTADEEEGSANGVDWLLREHRPLVDAAFAINPDGGEAGMEHGKHRYLVMQTSEKIYVTYKLEVTDKGGHSSRPTPDNPIYRLAHGLDRLASYQFPVHLTETTKLYFARRAALENGQLKTDMLQMAKAHPDASSVKRLAADINTNILLRTTCTATMLEGGHAENALPQRAQATIQCRVVPGETPESVQKLLAGVVRDPTVTIKSISSIVLSPESVPTQEVLQPLEQLVHAMWPEVAVLPQMSPGASDSIYTRAAGIPTYGIDAMFTDIDDDRFHGRDERISVQAFQQELEFTRALMRSLSLLH